MDKALYAIGITLTVMAPNMPGYEALRLAFAYCGGLCVGMAACENMFVRKDNER